MASTTKPARKKFRVAVSGATVDGREIQPQHLRDAAASYNPDVYGARVNVEHYLSMLPDSNFGAMGDVVALSAEDITEGPLPEPSCQVISPCWTNWPKLWLTVTCRMRSARSCVR